MGYRRLYFGGTGAIELAQDFAGGGIG
jgi:hypothetical protein